MLRQRPIPAHAMPTCVRFIGMRYVLLFLLALTCSGLASAQSQRSLLDDPTVRARAQHGLDRLYNVDFDAADSLFTLVADEHPDHPIGPFLKALGTWWQILLDLNDTSHDQTFYDEMDIVIARSDARLRRSRSDFDARFFKGAALGFRGRLRSNRGQYLRAARDGRDAMDYVLSIADADTSRADFGFGKGLYDYYIAATGDRYPAARPFLTLFPSGNKARGLDLLNRTADDGTFLKTEAHYFLMQIEYLFENDFSATREHVTWLRQRYPDNPFFHTAEGRILARWHQWGQADDVWADVLNKHLARTPYYGRSAAEQALYYLARSHASRGDYRQALVRYTQLETYSKGRPNPSYFAVVGRLRQGQTFEELGKKNEAAARYRQVLAMPDKGSAHENARRYLSQL